jgi:magnesium chelatase family protein
LRNEVKAPPFSVPFTGYEAAMQIMAYAPYGSEGIIIRVEADIRRGIPGIDITGLAEGAVREARERVRASFRNSGYPFPQDRILINLAPAGVRTDGASLDLPIALSVMAAASLAPAPAAGPDAGTLMVMGELELSGRIRPVRGVLAAVAAGLRAGIRRFIVPGENAREAAVLVRDRGCFAAAATLDEAVRALGVRAGTGLFPAYAAGAGGEEPPGEDGGAGDFAEVRGQDRYKRVLEIAAAGGHNVLAFGPPGAGKTMLARRMPSIMPPLLPEESVELTRIHSLAGLPETGEFSLITRPPFRSPHHSASAEGVLGGGRTVRPGEISLAQFGVLFLDEAPQFKAPVLQALRETLEDRFLTISRAGGALRLPADFQLLLAANPCPCGRLGTADPAFRGPGPGDADLPAGFGGVVSSGCFCSADGIYRYWRKFGAALLDRVELRVPVIPGTGLLRPGREESSAAIARRVLRAVELQRRRFKGTGVRRNARMPPGLIDEHCALGGEEAGVLERAVEKLGLSGRAFHGILRVARTIADLEGSGGVRTVHLLEAVQHRRLGDDPYDVLIRP